MRASSKLTRTFFGTLLLATASTAYPDIPPITGVPQVDSPPLLAWPHDGAMGVPDLTEPTANRLFDLHGRITNCDGIDLVFSTAGNYHMALHELWQTVLLPRYGSEVRSWYYTTSPPVADTQATERSVAFGNLALRCAPQVAAGPAQFVQRLQSLGLAEGAPVKIFNNRGNVILVKKGNPKRIRSVWDLRHPDVRVILPHPALEKSTFDNYSQTIYNIAANDPSPPDGWTADRLFNSIFNQPQAGNRGHDDDGRGQDAHHDRTKWLRGERIHHREVPWSVAYGRADAGILFYHLALDAVRSFPDLFEIVPLGGTADDPRPVAGNRVGAHFAVRMKGDWNARQLQARETLMGLLSSGEFGDILEFHGLARP